MEAIREFNVFIVSDSEHLMEDYIMKTYEALHNFDPGAEIIAGSVIKNEYNEGVNAAFLLIDGYMKNKSMLTLDELERYKHHLQLIMK